MCRHMTMTSLCVNVHKTGLSECIKVVDYFRKENLKDKKEELERINKWLIIYCYCVNNMLSICNQ